MQTILVTGAAGFIGFHCARNLLERGHSVLGLDNLNNYYDVSLKESRLSILRNYKQFRFVRLNLQDKTGIEELFRKERFGIVLNLAAQAGVRYSLVNPHSYTESNITGFLNILEGCRKNEVLHLVYASSSSVYGANTLMPFSVHHNVDHPVSLYAATKKANELMAHSYSCLYGLPCTGLRFFTVYGPWGRPDMAAFIFTRAILEGAPIDIYNYGKMKRDFTFIDDIVEGIVRVLFSPPEPDPNWNGAGPDPGSSFAPYRIYNIGNNEPIQLLRFISILEGCLGRKAKKNYLPAQPGDVPETYADVGSLMRDFDYRPSTGIEEGLQRFVNWYLEFYDVRLASNISPFPHIEKQVL
jgi:UDP-glucuronate 4-epimerase